MTAEINDRTATFLKPTGEIRIRGEGDNENNGRAFKGKKAGQQFQ